MKSILKNFFFLNPGFRVLLVIAVFYFLFLTVTSVRRYFDEEDLNKARMIFQKITVQDLECSFELKSRYEGKVDVSCFSKKENGGGKVFVWQIDVISARLVPKNDLAKDFLGNR